MFQVCKAELCYRHSSKWLGFFFLLRKKANGFDCSCCQQHIHTLIWPESGITFLPTFSKIPPSLSIMMQIMRSSVEPLPVNCRASNISQGLVTGKLYIQDIGVVSLGDTNSCCLSFPIGSVICTTARKGSLLKGLNSHFLSSSKSFLFFPGYLFIAVIAIGFTGIKADWGYCVYNYGNELCTLAFPLAFAC